MYLALVGGCWDTFGGRFGSLELVGGGLSSLGSLCLIVAHWGSLGLIGGHLG